LEAWYQSLRGQRPLVITPRHWPPGFA